MNNDKRLIPFIGGLAIGGLGGAALNKNNYMPYYQYPVYQYPYYTYYPYQQTYYPNFNQQNLWDFNSLVYCHGIQYKDMNWRSKGIPC